MHWCYIIAHLHEQQLCIRVIVKSLLSACFVQQHRIGRHTFCPEVRCSASAHLYEVQILLGVTTVMQNAASLLYTAALSRGVCILLRTGLHWIGVGSLQTCRKWKSVQVCLQWHMTAINMFLTAATLLVTWTALQHWAVEHAFCPEQICSALESDHCRPIWNATIPGCVFQWHRTAVNLCYTAALSSQACILPWTKLQCVSAGSLHTCMKCKSSWV